MTVFTPATPVVERVQRGGTARWETVQTSELHLSHDPPCPRCGHPMHFYLACSDACDCVPPVLPGTFDPAA